MDIIGHDRVLHYLREGLRTQHLSPSLMFVGPEGVGKRSVALELAKCFACQYPENGSDLPRCGLCPPCRRITDGGHLDVFTLDRATQAAIVNEKPETQTTVKIEAVRHLDKFLRLKPAESRRRVAIIDEAQRMNNDSANALLKVLEEPPPLAQIVLCVSDEHSLPATLRSRCAVLYFRPVAEGVLAAWLEKTGSLEAERAAEIADRSGGSFARALSLKEADEPEPLDLAAYDVEEFFTLLAKTNFRKEGRRVAEVATTQLIEDAERRLRAGDMSQAARLEAMVEARRRIDRNMSPRLALEALFLKLQNLQKDRAPAR
jgi:DNA polymerase-3 subunit delta'